MRIGVVIAIVLSASGSAWAQTPEAVGESEPETAPEPGPIASPVLTCETILLATPISFEPGDDALDGRGRAVVERIAALLDENPWVTRLRIDVHNDATGSSSFNRRLTDKRAELIVNELYLNGIERERVEARGHGEDMPIAPNDTAEGRARNRRVELHVEGEGCPFAD